MYLNNHNVYHGDRGVVQKGDSSHDGILRIKRILNNMEKMKNEIITDKTYLSEVMSELPSKTLLNKGVTGCGGTYVELHSNRNSLILVPTIELAKNKKEKDFLIVYGKISNDEIKKYIQSDIKYKKIIGTYDCLSRVIELYPEIFSYFLLVDEYHILFNSYSFRNDAIQFLLKNYQRFANYVFMTATPLDDDIILDEIKSLPRLNITWTKAQAIKLNLIDTTFTSKELIKILLKNSEPEINYHIFLNSIKTIKDIVTKANLSDYKVVCSETSRQNNRTLKMGTTLDAVAKYNFYTSTAFEGCDIFDPTGKTIILCDTNIATTILDISTLVRQICGRLRDSIYKEEVTLILNTSKHRYAGTSAAVFKTLVQENITLGKYTEEKFNTDEDSLYKEKELRSYSAETYNSFYVNRYNNVIFYDDNLRKMDEYNYKLITEIYNSSISVIKEASKYQIEVSDNTNQNWITEKLKNKEYSFSELEQLFAEDFLKLGLVFNGYIIKDYFPTFVKIRKVKNKIRETYYKFEL